MVGELLPTSPTSKVLTFTLQYYCYKNVNNSRVQYKTASHCLLRQSFNYQSPKAKKISWERGIPFGSVCELSLRSQVVQTRPLADTPFFRESAVTEPQASELSFSICNM